ncbi:MAG: metallophosphoesterase [Clostridia bacterium]|nr:metallophosphoesterase [Clostridia bacterium]
MAIFVLGDPHLSFSSHKPMDIFGSRWENHHEKIKKAWLEKVSAEDTVVLAGDLSWAMSLKEAEADLRFFHELPGRKVLLKGNHDYWWETVAKMERFLAERKWEDFFFLFNVAIPCEDVVLCGTRGWEPESTSEQDKKLLEREVQRLRHSLEAAGEEKEKIVFFHYPPFGGDQAPYETLLKQYGVRRVYYGHIHGPAALQAGTTVRDGISYTLISADALDFCPLLIHPEPKTNQNNQKRCGFWVKLLSYFKGKC